MEHPAHWALACYRALQHQLHFHPIEGCPQDLRPEIQVEIRDVVYRHRDRRPFRGTLDQSLVVVTNPVLIRFGAIRMVEDGAGARLNLRLYSVGVPLVGIPYDRGETFRYIQYD